MTNKHQGWQPIATAPRDGSWILLAGGEVDYQWDYDEQPPMVVGFLHQGPLLGDLWMMGYFESGYIGEYENPTHWMPLPPSPEQEGGL